MRYCGDGDEGALSSHCLVVSEPVQRARKLVSVHCSDCSSGVADMNA
jgi:hypothetical protein